MKDFKQKFISAGNDYDALSERTGGDEELIAQLMQMFLDDDSWESMCSSIEAGECEKAFRAAHSLKGSSGMLGLSGLFAEMKVISDKLRVGELDAAKAVFDEVRSEYETTVELIRDFV